MYNQSFGGRPPYYDERFGGFFVTLLLGGLGGAAIVGASRPRPVFVTPPYQPFPPYGNFGYGNYYYNY